MKTRHKIEEALTIVRSEITLPPCARSTANLRKVRDALVEILKSDLVMREELAEILYENIPDDEAYSIVHRHIRGEVFSLAPDQVKRELKKAKEGDF